ncbi:MAG: acyl--CoA ligase [Clostridiales bacterium]|nr:acyl--CoA ligase [Clostridiales bacterium]
MEYKSSNKSIFAYVKENVQKYGEKVMLLNETESYTFKEFFAIYNYLIFKFKSWGIGKGKTVAVTPPRSIDAPFVLFAVVATEAVLVLSDPQKTVEEYLGHCSAKIDHDYIIRQNGYGVWLCECKDGRVFTFNKNDGVGFEDVADAPLTCDNETPSYIFFTSGSTGKSKAALLTQYAMLNNGYNQLSLSGGTDKDITILIMPLHHVFGVQILESNIAMGCKIFIPKTREKHYVLDCIEKYEVNHLDAVPTFYYMLLEAQKERPRDLSKFKKGIIAGGAYSKQQFISIENGLGIKVCPSYGMTETSTVVCFTPINATLENRSKGIGQFLPTIDGVLKTADGKIVTETGGVGEICVRGYCVMKGYITDHGLDLPVDEDGYFHTGDLAYIDENDYLYIVGRCKDIIIRGGENISPLKIQNAIVEMEGVLDAHIVGVPSEKYGEEVGACIVANGVSQEDVIEYLTPLLKKYEIPTKYLFLEKMPALSGTGKPDKQLIIKLLSKQH